MLDAISFAILALGAARVTLLIVRDDIFEPIRELLFKISPPESDAAPAGIVGGILSCPDCCGVWVAGFSLLCYALFPTTTVLVGSVFAVAMIVSLIARRY